MFAMLLLLNGLESDAVELLQSTHSKSGRGPD
jgi:hypothetical protein